MLTDKPYDEYVDRAIAPLHPYQHVSMIGDEIVFQGPYVGPLSVRELRRLLTDAWLAGLAYSVDIIHEETKSPLRARLRDAPKVYTGSKMREPFLWEKCE